MIFCRVGKKDVQNVVFLELHFRSLFTSAFGFVLFLLVKSEHLGKKVVWEGAHQYVVLLYRFVITAACLGNAVLGSFQLGLQFGEVLVGLQIRIVFRDGQQFALLISPCAC